MITSNRASLVITSETGSAANVTQVLGIEPERIIEAGDRRYSTWISVEFGVTEEEDDGSGLSSVESLLAVFEPKLEGFRRLSAEYRLEVCWYGDSDSSQGGFVLVPELMGRLAALELGFVGSVWSADSE
jgi:hypothetical protein